MTINQLLLTDKEFQEFLSFLYKKIVFREAENKDLEFDLKFVGIKYKVLEDIFGDRSEIRQYLNVLEKEEIVKLKRIIQGGKVLSPMALYRIKRYGQQTIFHPDDWFIFNEYDKQRIQKAIKKIEAEEISRKARTRRKSKITIFISKEKGVYRKKKNKILQYPIKGKKRPHLIRCLKDSWKDTNTLREILKYDSPQLSKEKKAINDNFKMKLELRENLIVRRDTGGYQLNQEIYDIKFID